MKVKRRRIFAINACISTMGRARSVHDTMGKRREGLLHTRVLEELPSDALIRYQLPRLGLNVLLISHQQAPNDLKIIVNKTVRYPI
jgi:hypothetical protein